MPQETKRFSIPSLQLKADTPGSLAVEFATLNVIDLDGDVTVPGAFGEQDIRIQASGHNLGDWTIGKGKIRESGDKAIMDGLLNLSMSEGKEAYESLKFDLENGPAQQEWSYVFDVLDADFGEHEGRSVRFLKRLKVYSVDPVFLGAGLDTRTTAVKSRLSFEAHLEQALADTEELLSRVKARIEVREKEGRTLSTANLATLRKVAEALKSSSTDLEKLLIDADPEKGEDELVRQKLRYLALEAGLQPAIGG